MVEHTPEWTASGVIEAPVERVVEALLAVREGAVGRDNGFLLHTVPGAGRLMSGARLTGGPNTFQLHYGLGGQPGGTVEVDRERRWFAMQGGFKFRVEYQFEPHERGTLMRYTVFNVAPPSHRRNPLVRLQFRLAAALRVGLRSTLRRIGSRLDCPAHPLP